MLADAGKGDGLAESLARGDVAGAAQAAGAADTMARASNSVASQVIFLRMKHLLRAAGTGHKDSGTRRPGGRPVATSGPHPQASCHALGDGARRAPSRPRAGQHHIRSIPV